MDALESEGPGVQRLLQEVDLPTRHAELTMASGRRYEVLTGEDGVDRVRIHGGGGQLVLAVEVTDAGPVLTVTGAVVQLEATRSLRMAAPEIALESSGAMTLSTGGDLVSVVGGDQHTRVSGAQRSEARAIELQASDGHVAVRARERITLDGEHIGLNDDPLPQPFGWSAIAFEEG
ncbi:MAG: hypothetical protein WKG00_21945 [Polyangiaceae bacterium]